MRSSQTNGFLNFADSGESRGRPLVSNPPLPFEIFITQGDIGIAQRDTRQKRPRAQESYWKPWRVSFGSLQDSKKAETLPSLPGFPVVGSGAFAFLLFCSAALALLFLRTGRYQP